MAENQNSGGMNFVRRTSMVPFLALEKGEWWIVRNTGRDKKLVIKGKENDVIKFDHYGGGRIDDGLPDAVVVAGLLKRTPTPVLTGAHKAIVEGIYFDDKGKETDPKGKVFLLAFAGKKELAGGRSFNQWDIYEIAGV